MSADLSTTNTAAREVLAVMREAQKEYAGHHSSGTFRRLADKLEATLTQQQGGECSHMRRLDQICDPCTRYPKQQGGEQAGDVEQQARELLAAEYEQEGYDFAAKCIRGGNTVSVIEDRAIRAIVAALRSKQPAASEGDVELSVLEAIEREMLYIAPEMKRPDLANGLDLVPNFYDALKAMFTSKQAVARDAARYRGIKEIIKENRQDCIAPIPEVQNAETFELWVDATIANYNANSERPA